MNEETGQKTVYIHKLHDKKYQSPGSRSQPTLDTQRPEFTDKYGTFCGQYGHGTTTCTFMAKLLIASESLNKVDQKTKKELQEVFKQAQQKQREKRLKQHTNTIQQLLDHGGSREDIDKLLTRIQGGK